MVYEAFKRHVESTNAVGLRKFQLMVTVGELIEGDDTTEFFIGCSLFLPRRSITVETLRAGWDTWPNFHLLRSRASIEAHFEVQTLLCLTSQETESEIAQILRIFKENEPAAAEAAMEVGS